MEALILPYVAPEKIQNPEIITLLDKTNLNWNVKKEALMTAGGIQITDKVALIREDNNDVLSIMGNGYEVYQNYELLELLYQISKSTGLEVCNGGDFDSKKIWFQFKTDDLNLGNDKVKGYITGVNSFDGSTSLGFGNSNVTISCMNTFFAATKQLDTKIKHSINLRPRIDKILFGIDNLLNEEKHTFNTIQRLRNLPITDNVQDVIIRTMFELSPVEKINDLSTRKSNQIETFKQDWNHEINEKGQNMWGALSAATFYTTHHANRNIDRRNELKMFGKSGISDRAVWKKIVELVA
jgi:hypothetical protein